MLDPRIRNLECSPEAAQHHGDIRTSVWSRDVRVKSLTEAYRGKLNMVNSAKILADHYDPYLKTARASNRSVCKHCELDDASHSSEPSVLPFMPEGSVDAAVVDSATASQMSILFRFGSSCGRPFKKIEYFAAHPEWEHLAPYIKDRPSRPWTKI